MEKNNKGKEILKLLQENYEIETAKDLSSALKDMFKGALQEMMNAEFDSSMGYSKYDKKTEKTNYRNGSTKKNLKSEFGSFEFETPRDRNGEFEIKIPVDVKYDKFVVGYIEDGSVKETFDATYKDGYVTFKTTHLSEYAIFGISRLNSGKLEAKFIVLLQILYFHCIGRK